MDDRVKVLVLNFNEKIIEGYQKYNNKEIKDLEKEIYAIVANKLM